MKKTAKKVALMILMALAPVFLFATPSSFYLQETKSSALYGPFPVKSGFRVQLNGQSYALRIVGKDRLAFLAPDRQIFGPLQMVEGRLVNLRGSMYAFYLHEDKTAPVPRQVNRASRPEPFIPAPPPRPKPISVTEETPHRVVPAKDLPELPRAENTLAFAAWLAFVDDTPIDWKVDSLNGTDSALERTTIGVDCFWNAFSARLSYSPSLKSGDIVPNGVGITGSSLDDGSGVALQVGYSRPFLKEGGWVASAGVRGSLRRDKADLTTRSLTGHGVDTNGLVSADYISATTSLTIDEYSIWLDLKLGYSADVWGVHAGFSIQPVSEYKIDGDFVFGGKRYSIECDRDVPIAFGFGGWYDYRDIRYFGNISFGATELFRLGALYEF